MTTAPTSGAAIQRYKIGYHADEWGQRSSTPSGIPDASGSWVRYADHVTALAAGQATAAQQGAYAALPECLTCSDHGAVGNILTAEDVPAVEREQERIAFKDAHRHLDLDEVPDAWGRPMFKHSHVEASWLGWIARASHGQAPATVQADSVQEDAARLDFIERHPEMSLRHRKGRWAFLGFTNYEYEMLPSLRAAIDATRKQGGAT